jgi:hypothetical protein
MATLRPGVHNIDGEIIDAAVFAVREVVRNNDSTAELACVRACGFLGFCFFFQNIYHFTRILNRSTSSAIVDLKNPDSALYWPAAARWLAFSGYTLPGDGGRTLLHENRLVALLHKGDHRSGHYFVLLIDLKEGRALCVGFLRFFSPCFPSLIYLCSPSQQRARLLVRHAPPQPDRGAASAVRTEPAVCRLSCPPLG